MNYLQLNSVKCIVLRCSIFKSTVTLKFGLGFLQGHRRRYDLIDRILLLLMFSSNYGSILHHFYIFHFENTAALKSGLGSLKVIANEIIR